MAWDQKRLCTGVHHVSRWALCAVLAISAAGKLLTPYEEAYVVPEALYYLGAIVELVAAVLLHMRHRTWAIATAIVLAVFGISLGVAVPGELCGCFGSLVRLEGKYHVLVSGAVGALACFMAMTDARSGSLPPPGSREPALS